MANSCPIPTLDFACESAFNKASVICEVVMAIAVICWLFFGALVVGFLRGR